MPLDLGVSSPPIELVYGRNELLIDFTVGELSRGYQIALDRGAATPTEYTYAKPVIRIAEVRFGQVLAVSGDRVAVGAEDNSSVGNPTVPNNNAPNSGVVYVLRRGGEEWVHDGYLKGTSIRAGQRLGASVDMDGSVIVAGTQCEDNGLVGSVHVFRRGATTWVEEQRITRTNATPDDGFGRAVAVHGDVVAVNSEFGVHIYRRVDGVWTEEATLTIPGRFGFGRRIVLHADVAIIADPYDSSSQTGISTSAATDAGRPYSGAVYVYRRVNSMWTLEAYIKASNPDGADLFGFSIAFDGQVLVVGAPEERSGDGNQQDNSVAYAGAAYVFQRGASAWSQVAYLKSATPQRADAFGAAVAVRGDTLVAGAHESGDLGSTPGRKGTVHLFRRIAGLWTRAPILQASNREDGDFFGGAVALSRDGLVVGAMYEDGRATPMDNDASGNGAVYVFR